MKIREAGPDDIDDVYELSNDPSVRAVSFSSEPILYETHRIWYRKILTDPESLLLLLYDNKRLSAQIRFKRVNEACSEISISVSGAYRGQGVGRDFMEKATEILKTRWPVTTVKARVKCDNEASKNFFTRCGYHLNRHCIKKTGYECNEYSKRI